MYFVKVLKMNNIKCPCYGCNERNTVCHDDCKKYIDWKINHEAERERESKERALKWLYNDIKANAIEKVRKRKK